MLQLTDIDAGYGGAQVLRRVSIDVQAGEIHCLFGRNGAGKTTTMQTIMGLVRPTGGYITLDGKNVSDLAPYQVPQQGIGYVPQGRRLFGELTVAQNIEVGLMTRQSGAVVRDQVLDTFPRLKERMSQRANTLSGGEQQMLAMARAMCVRPRVLLLDEPTEGLQPSMIEAIRDVIVQMRAQGVAVLLVEQRVEAVLSVADRVTFLENGRVTTTVSAADVRSDPALLHRFLGV